MIAKIRNNFTLIGKLGKAKNKDKKEVELTEITSKTSKWKGFSFEAMINCGEDGNHRVKFFGGDNTKGKGFDDKTFKDGDNEFKVRYEDRNDPEGLSKVKRVYKRTIKFLNGEIKEFIYQGEFVEYIAENIEMLSSLNLKLTGELELSLSNDKKVLYKKYSVNHIEEVEEDEKPKARGTMQLFYTSSSVDRNLFDGQGKLNIPYLNDIGNKISLKCFIETRNQNKNLSMETIFYPIEVSLDMRNLDFTNDKHVRMANLMIKNFDVKDNNVYATCWEAKFINAQEIIQYTPEQIEQLLTPEEREYAELFGESVDEIIARKQGDNVYGDRINETRIFKPNKNLPIKTEQPSVTVDMLEIYKSIETEQKTEVLLEEKKETKKEKDIQEDEFEELFG